MSKIATEGGCDGRDRRLAAGRAGSRAAQVDTDVTVDVGRRATRTAAARRADVRLRGIHRRDGVWSRLVLARWLARLGVLPLLIRHLTDHSEAGAAQMKKFSMVSLGGLAAAAALTTVGVGTAVAQPDYGALPVNPNAITDSSAYVPMPPVLNPDGQQGLEQEFNHRDGSRGITTTIVVLPSAQDATGSMNAWQSGLGSVVANQTSQPVPVGTGGTWVTGRRRTDRSRSVSCCSPKPMRRSRSSSAARPTIRCLPTS